MKIDIEITVANSLLNDEYITKEEYKRLKHDNVKVFDNVESVFEIVNNDVYIHSRGAFPLILKDYLTILEG